MKFKIIFFDCDGVLLFGNPWQMLAQAVNLPLELDQKWLEDFYSNKITFDEWIKNVESFYRKAGLTRKRFKEVLDLKDYSFNEEAEELFAYLKKENYEIAIISSGADYYVSRVAEHFGIKNYKFNTIVDFDENGIIARLKTFGEDPDAKVVGINEVCQELGVDPTETLFVGDSTNDTKAFRYTKHGVLYASTVKGVWNHVNPELEKAAWRRITNLNEIREILEDANSD